MVEDMTLVRQRQAVAGGNAVSDAGLRYGSGVRAASIAGKFLVAAPSLQESCFTRSVVYMCSYNESGAMGIVVNYPIENVRIDDIMEQLGIESEYTHGSQVFFGCLLRVIADS